MMKRASAFIILGFLLGLLCPKINIAFGDLIDGPPNIAVKISSSLFSYLRSPINSSNGLAAYNAVLPLSGGTMTGTITGADSGTWGSGGASFSTLADTGLTTAGFATNTAAGIIGTITGAAGSDVDTGTSTAKPVTPSALIGSAAQQTPSENSNAATVNWQSGYNAAITLNANLTSLTLSNPSDGICYTLRIIQPASGGPYTVTWPGSVDWGTAGTPTLSTAANAIDLITLCYSSAASKYQSTIAFGF